VHGFYTFNSGVEEERDIRQGRGPFSSLRITRLSQETVQYGQRNPLQKATAHKEVLNLSTPPKVLSRPP